MSTRAPRSRSRRITVAGIIAGFAAAAVIVPGAFYLNQTVPEQAPVMALTITHTKLRVGVLPVIDVAAFYRALDAGYFTNEGLDVEAVRTPSGPAAISDLTKGTLDIAFSSYPGILQARSSTEPDLRIVAPAYTARPGALMLVVAPDSGITRMNQLAGKRIAVTGTGSISDLGVLAQLREGRVNVKGIHWVAMPMQDMGAAIQRGDVDGAVVAEPYIALNDDAFHARPILDAAMGRTARIPLSGWGALASLEKTSPGAAARFARALQQASADLADRAKLEKVLVNHLNVDATAAREVRIADFTTTLDPNEIQRVADLMTEFNAIQHPLDVRSALLYP
jgi:NitT/TauT family transport system substrate-binding protein